MTPLIAGSIGGDVETLKLLIARGANVNFRPAASEGLARRNALESAVAFGYLDCVRVLLEHGADVNGVGPFGPALSNAAFMDRFDIAQVLPTALKK
jgi:ankyrin repeat protein